VVREGREGRDGQSHQRTEVMSGIGEDALREGCTCTFVQQPPSPSSLLRHCRWGRSAYLAMVSLKSQSSPGEEGGCFMAVGG